MKPLLTIIGQGKMGTALAKRFLDSNVSVQLVGRTKEEIKGRFVLLAIPYEDVLRLLSSDQDELASKVIIDISNPMDYTTRQSTLLPHQSASLQLATLFPRLTFIKAFNTNFSSQRVPAAISPLVLMAGDSEIAKKEWESLLRKAGFSCFDVGGLERSRDLEAFARVQLQLLEGGNSQFLIPFSI